MYRSSFEAHAVQKIATTKGLRILPHFFARAETKSHCIMPHPTTVCPAEHRPSRLLRSELCDTRRIRLLTEQTKGPTLLRIGIHNLSGNEGPYFRAGSARTDETVRGRSAD